MMAIIWYAPLLFLIVYLLLLCHQYFRGTTKKTSIPLNWPIFGMFPSLFLNEHRIHDYVTDALRGCGYTFVFKGPWLSSVNLLITCDPANIHYMLSKNFSNFQKGPEFKVIFDILGEGIFNAEAESWENQRKALMPLVNQHEFYKFTGSTTWNKLEKGLIPILEHAAETGMEIDLQELLEKFTFDTSCIMALGHDPASLGTDLPENEYVKAFVDAEEAIFHRHMLPAFYWKLQRWLQIGKEKKLTKAKVSLNQFLDTCIAVKSEELKGGNQTASSQEEGGGLDLLTRYMKKLTGCQKENGSSALLSQKVWADALLNLIFAGKDTISAGLTWFFWLLATNPVEENMVLQECVTNLHVKQGTWEFSNIEEIKNLVHLHGALCESLRLFPPVAMQHKAPAKVDILPSGHRLNPNAKTVLSFYSMGRMEKIWGTDCCEFKPQRWISEHGGIKHEPSFKFTAFNAGPRTCLGKDVSFIQMKIVAAAIICRFQFQILQSNRIATSNSVILHMRHGLKVKVSKRNVGKFA
ncbi:OLC1v1025946C1 [Oldenlandia corymbosa var. corymbosa]|uniref:OLC1v1025946C1 n=1 Tax=Oldenlandia corymbosa var. corymbosa TaxID=529605 RepID=A0AAV1C8S3_OLDCO|nr:OLC1v1025946C1 [Oldenlandia corymbosa var. corymbosa]